MTNDHNGQPGTRLLGKLRGSLGARSSIVIKLEVEQKVQREDLHWSDTFQREQLSDLVSTSINEKCALTRSRTSDQSEQGLNGKHLLRSVCVFQCSEGILLRCNGVFVGLSIKAAGAYLPKAPPVRHIDRCRFAGWELPRRKARLLIGIPPCEDEREIVEPKHTPKRIHYNQELSSHHTSQMIHLLLDSCPLPAS